MIERIHEKASKTTLLVATAATIFFSAIMMLVLLPQFLGVSGGMLPLDMRITYTPAEFNNLATVFGNQGIVIYHLFHTFDMGFPISLAIALSSGFALINSVIFPKDSRLRTIAILPFITAIFDYLENVLVWYQLDMYPSVSTNMIQVTSYVSTTKLGLLMSSIVLVVVWVVAYLTRKEKA